MTSLSSLIPVAAEHLWAGSKDLSRTQARAERFTARYDPIVPGEYLPLAAKAALETFGSGPTYNRYRSSLSSLLRALRLLGGPRLELPPLAAENPPKERVLTPEEESAILSLSSPPWLSPLVALLLDTGLRLSEVYRARVTEDGGLALDTTKNGDPRWVPLSSRCLSFSLPPASNPAVAWSLPSERSVRRVLTNALSQLGIEGVTPHTFRHTAVTRLSERLQGRSDAMPVIMKIVGHRNPATTLRYLHPSRDALKEVVS